MLLHEVGDYIRCICRRSSGAAGGLCYKRRWDTTTLSIYLQLLNRALALIVFYSSQIRLQSNLDPRNIVPQLRPAPLRTGSLIAQKDENKSLLKQSQTNTSIRFMKRKSHLGFNKNNYLTSENPGSLVWCQLPNLSSSWSFVVVFPILLDGT